MIGLLRFVLAILASPFKSKIRLEAENAVLRHQLIVLRRKMRGGVQLANSDRWFFVQLYRWFPSILEVLTVIRPETLVGWHRAGFRSYWRWKSRPLGGRPQIERPGQCRECSCARFSLMSGLRNVLRTATAFCRFRLIRLAKVSSLCRLRRTERMVCDGANGAAHMAEPWIQCR